MATNKKILSFNENSLYKTVPVVLSLSALFPKAVLDAYSSHCSDTSENIRTFISALLPEEYKEINTLIYSDALALESFWNGNISNIPIYDHFFIAFKDHLLLTSPVCVSESHAIIVELQKNLEPIIKKMPADMLQAYKQEIYDLCIKIVDKRSKFSGLDYVDLYKAFPILDINMFDNSPAFLTSLAHLTVLACTSSIWCKPEKKSDTDAKNAARKLFPCAAANYLDLTYHDGIGFIPRICWASLFPQTFLSVIQKRAHDSFPDTTKEWFRFFIPDEFQHKDGKPFFITNRKTSYSNYWCGKNEGNAPCTLLKNKIVQEGKKLSTKYDAFLKHIDKRCKDLLKLLSQEELIAYQEDILNLFLQLQKNSKALLGIDALDLPSNDKTATADIDDLSQKLLYFILIASTWTIWADPKNKKHAKELATVLFPHKDTQDPSDICDDIIEHSNDDASQKLKDAQQAFHNHDIEKCGDLCREIISNNLADDSILGDAYFYLVRCHDDFNYRYEGYYNRKEFQSRALSFGSKQALAAWSSRRLDSLLYLPKQEEAPSFSIVTNVAANDYRMDLYLRSFTNKADNHYSPSYVKTVKNTSDFSRFIKPNSHVQILLLDDDHEKNYMDLLFILDSIKNWNKQNEDTQVYTKSAWENHKIYIRLNETKYASLLDTTLKHMDGLTIQVLLIDDNKWAAQYLLSHFPLFYPIRSLSKEVLSSNNITINLNVISESDNELTHWILREAYWLGCFYYTGVTLAIHVISPKARSIESRLKFSCPGITLPIPDSDKASKVLWDYECKLDQLESQEFYDYLESLRKTRNSYNYYIVNCDTDISSLNLAIKIREWEIRNTVKSNAAIKSANFPVITYHCENLDIAHMAESMVVHQEAYGDNWYNNYSIIPFNASSRYQFNEIDGGYFEKMSQSVHLQYCGCPTDASDKTKSDFLDDYFTRCYNHDSSMAVALSIPYRLFQMTTDTSDHILPVGWVLKNTEAYSDSVSLNAMAEQASERNYINKQEMFNYERARWMRYMISRGWQAATAEETIKFMKAGNPRRQLYIGLMHGCICSQEDLMKLQEELYNEYKYGLLTSEDKRFAGNDPRYVTKNNKTVSVFDKYFQYDYSNLNQTADIISTRWFSEKTVEKIKSVYKER